MANITACVIVPALALSIGAGSVQASGQAPVLSGSVLALARQCATDIHPLTMGYLVAAESSNNLLAIGVNGNYRLPRQPANHEEAVATIRWLTEHNYNFDVGWGQVNSGNFAFLGVTGESLLDGCTNLRASARVLNDCYKTAVADVGEGQGALQRALSCYNTGSQSRGFRNGYVGRLLATAKQLHVPALEGGPLAQAPVAASNTPATSTKDQPSKKAEGTPDAFAQEAGGAFADSSPEALRTQPPPDTQETQDAGVSNSSTPAGGSIP
ncbi:lytic transglycosylase domain-containing protein (plasmid) [Xanthomonas albilineans]|uniref:Probable lytic transglycosylase protein n=1 Tax=Xanthomonas albilineans (strain GPE PC73 / CFBP 7063) TaxID=380358 RepID=D6CK98_XANAP|nr:lytic transglycosylase domain-containing protein [Xanthomonas albilineans]CAZ15887.1 probable lytic transglycosylase protein [Xanthomonas albilineans]